MSIMSITLQMLIVVTPEWDAVNGELFAYEKVEDRWELAMPPIAVCVGKQGMAWGLGLHQNADGETHLKKEGDAKAPAGIFSLSQVFGDPAHQRYSANMPYIEIEEDLECVDDVNSRYYNRFVYRQRTQDCDWMSSERMKEVGPLYAIGVCVEHNTQPVVRGMGSAIFMHIWRTPTSGTAGCTAMREEDLNQLVSWLDARKNPCLVQLPLAEYQKKQNDWNLPILVYKGN